MLCAEIYTNSTSCAQAHQFYLCRAKTVCDQDFLSVRERFQGVLVNDYCMCVCVGVWSWHGFEKVKLVNTMCDKFIMQGLQDTEK